MEYKDIQNECMNALDFIVNRSYMYPNELCYNLGVVDEIEKFSNFKIPFIYQACREKIIKNYDDVRVLEKDIYEWFNNNVIDILGVNYKIIKRKNNPKHIPDFWIENMDEICPVEIKLHNFDSKSLQQLQRYMDFYKCKKGIAVGKELSCEIPENVLFIKYSLHEKV